MESLSEQTTKHKKDSPKQWKSSRERRHFISVEIEVEFLVHTCFFIIEKSDGLVQSVNRLFKVTDDDKIIKIVV